MNDKEQTLKLDLILIIISTSNNVTINIPN